MLALLTGMSGVGKSTVVRELVRRGVRAYDADDDGLTEPRPDGSWGWRSDDVRALLDTAGDDLLVLAGCSPEQVQLAFDRVVLLTAPRQLQVERLRTRTGNDFGKHPAELAKVLADTDEVEPLLRRSAGLVVDTSRPLDDVVADVLAFLR